MILESYLFTMDCALENHGNTEFLLLNNVRKDLVHRVGCAVIPNFPYSVPSSGCWKGLLPGQPYKTEKFRPINLECHFDEARVLKGRPFKRSRSLTAMRLV